MTQLVTLRSVNVRLPQGLKPSFLLDDLAARLKEAAEKLIILCFTVEERPLRAA
jgi:hypothetical protein